MSAYRGYQTSYYSSRGSRVPGVVVALVVVGVIIWLALAFFSSPPAPKLSLLHSANRTVAGTPLVLPPAPSAQEAVALSGVGTIATAGNQSPTPIASLTKIMSALVILHDHPLALNQSGPQITVSPGDVATYNLEKAGGDSVVDVNAGESLSELQALQAALIPSGDNIVQLLATWDAGSAPAFVAKMNAQARTLGLSHTHYAEPSGVDPGSVSTANDQLRLAEVAMANPVFSNIVSMPQVTLPVAGTQYNVDADLGSNGIYGIKTGWVGEGGGCFAFAAVSNVDGTPVSLIGVILNDQSATPIPDALSQAKNILAAAEANLTTMRLPSGTVVAMLHAPYGHPVDVATSAPVSLVTWQGATLPLTLRTARNLSAGVSAGQNVGSLKVGSGGGQQSVGLHTTKALSGPSFGWKILNP